MVGFYLLLMKKFLACTMALGALAFSGCGEKEDGKASYALVTTGVASFWDICKKVVRMLVWNWEWMWRF